MIAEDQLSDEAGHISSQIWEAAKRSACSYANRLNDFCLHKQFTNRILEPFSYVDSVLSATHWGNFFNLRVAKDAQPEFCTLAGTMLLAMSQSTPQSKQTWDWHIPFLRGDEENSLDLQTQLKVSAARCARVSYESHGKIKDYSEDLKLADRLIKQGHWTPFEHQAICIQYGFLNQRHYYYSRQEEKFTFNMEKLLNDFKELQEERGLELSRLETEGEER